LADRELLLLAERGGLRTDDLLWRPGFTSWKSVHAVCGVKASPSIVTPKSAAGTSSITALLCIALVPFFAFREIARTVGEAEFRTLMLGPAKREIEGIVLEQGTDG
jgi:hypothetical protein